MSAPSIAAIQRAVCEHYDITINRLLCHRRHRKWTLPRQVGMYLAHEMTDCTLTQIGKAFDRDHTTALHAFGLIRKMRLSQEPTVSTAIDRIEASIHVDKMYDEDNYQIIYSDYGAGLLE